MSAPIIHLSPQVFTTLAFPGFFPAQPTDPNSCILNEPMPLYPGAGPAGMGLPFPINKGAIINLLCI